MKLIKPLWQKDKDSFAKQIEISSFASLLLGGSESCPDRPVSARASSNFAGHLHIKVR